MLVLDTDVLSIVQLRGGELYRRLDNRLQRAYDTETVAVTVVSMEEQARGWLAYLNKATAKDDESALITGYDRLREMFKDFETRTVLDFDEAAAERYHDLRKKKIRVGTMDLRIAGIILANNAVLLTRNVRDFSKIRDLRIEDWTS